MASEKSVALERMVAAYPKPALYALFIGFTIIEEQGKSEAVNTIMHTFFKDMPAEKLAKYRIAYAQFMASQNVASWPT